MGDGFNFKQLKAAILRLSHAHEWETAKAEWRLIDTYEADEPDTCLCGHYPIIEICTIKNAITKHEVDVGNVCIKRFLGIRSDLIFAAVKRIRRDNEKGIPPTAATFFYQLKVINDWEYGFLQDTGQKRVLTDRQLATRIKINTQILNWIARRGIA